jgi:AraC-like DNA-binding protein
MNVPGVGTVRGARLSTEHVRPQDQLAAWQEITASVFDVDPVGDPSSGFRGSIEIYDLGALQVAAVDMDPIACRHTNKHLRQSGIDHWSLTVVKEGRFHFEVEDRHLDASTGSLLMGSLVNPFAGVLEKTKFTSVLINRDGFWDIADELDRESHRFVSGPMATILRDFLGSVENHLPTMTRPETTALNEAFRSLLEAAVLNTADARKAAQEPIAAARFEQARRFISQNLNAPDLNADSLCKQLGMSRRQLYYLFSRYGGVAKYIQNRRLAACYHRLSTMTESSAISTIAYEYGFTNLSSFYRQFHARYGFRPSEARSARLCGHKPAAAEVRTFAEWMSLVAEN